MKIDIPELKSPLTVTEKRAYAEGMGQVIFHFQREAAYMFLNGGEGDQVTAERLRDMCTELMLKAGAVLSEASKLEADKAQLDEIREEIEKSLSKKAVRKSSSGCIEDDGRCNCNGTDISYAHSLALEQERIRRANGHRR